MAYKVHFFNSTGEAYDASQCDENIHDGDVLIVRNERVAGVLDQAWPVAVSEARGHFHRFANDDAGWAARARLAEAIAFAESYFMRRRV